MPCEIETVSCPCISICNLFAFNVRFICSTANISSALVVVVVVMLVVEVVVVVIVVVVVLEGGGGTGNCGADSS